MCFMYFKVFTLSQKFYSEGDTLIANCTLTEKAVNYTAHSLSFRTNHGVIIKSEHITVLSNRLGMAK